MKSLATKLTHLIALLAAMSFEGANAVAVPLPDEVKRCMDSAMVTEDNMLNGPEGCRETLMNYMRGNWRTVLEGLDSIAPTDSRKAVVMRACESLDATEYLAFLQTTRDLRVAGRITPSVFNDALGASRYKQGFLEFNYQHPEVRKFLESLRAFEPGGSMPKWMREILSGEAKKHLEEVLAAERNHIAQSTLLPPVESPPEEGEKAIGASGSTTTPVASLSAAPATSRASASPTTPFAKFPAAPTDERSPMWLWVVGILALIVILTVALKRRA